MATTPDNLLREQLVDRRHKLEAVIAGSHEHTQLTQLLNEVDSALSRIDSGSYGICEICHDPIEKEGLVNNPLLRVCLDHLSRDEQRALEQDLELASRMQRELLPEQNLSHAGWSIFYHYEPKGAVSGDYCDVVSLPGDGLFFAVGDVSGKGVAASMLMAHLRAIFRMLITAGIPLDQQIERANRVFCESTVSTNFATLVWGKAGTRGEIEICNAGHCAPMLVRAGQVTCIEPSGLPLGMFCGGTYKTEQLQLAKGETLVLFTDGLTEASNAGDFEYGTERLSRVVAANAGRSPEALIQACLQDLAGFQSGVPKRDDLSVMAIHRTE